MKYFTKEGVIKQAITRPFVSFMVLATGVPVVYAVVSFYGSKDVSKRQVVCLLFAPPKYLGHQSKVDS